MVLALVGVIAYTEENRRQQATGAHTALTAPATDAGKRQQAMVDEADDGGDSKLPRKLAQV